MDCFSARKHCKHGPACTHCTAEQAAKLEPDLEAYLATLTAVHGGADLASATECVLGYERAAVKGGWVASIVAAGACT